MLANANEEINMRRKEMIKPDLHDDYKHLCSSSIEPTSFLFGDELPKQLKDLTEVNRVGKKVTHSRSSKAKAFGYKSRPSFGYGRNSRYHSSKRPSFLGPRPSAQAGGTYQGKSYRKTAKTKQAQAQRDLRSTIPLMRYLQNMLKLKLQADCSNFSRLRKLLQVINTFYKP